MNNVASSSTVELLQYLHESLDAHFRELHAAREQLEPSSPVFALEHNLSPEDLALLKQTVRAAVQAGLGARHRMWWLPFVVYAAESGYDYVGDEYWRTFAKATPGWRDDQRTWIKAWFQKFATEYGGAVPTGAFAGFFKIIAWPITHAVLPTYLQRQLVQLLYEFSGALTSDLLDDPAALGLRLRLRASNYTERFRIFCENTTLVGQVAAALLSGANESTPYLLPSTLDRIIDGLSQEQESRHWLQSAQQHASRVRGFRAEHSDQAAATSTKTLPRATDPKLFLRFDGGWNAYVEVPDLTVLGAGLPEVYNQLRTSRATISGGSRSVPPSGLLYPGQEVRLASWPHPEQPIIQLERGDEKANRILATQCAVTKGPWWLFRRQGAGLAVEVKGKFVRPGHKYVLIGAEALSAPAVPWAREVTITAGGVKAYEFVVPQQVSESEGTALRASGLSIVSHVAIRPVGIVASSWDGEGEVEWLAGEPAMLGIRSDLLPLRCRVTIGNAVYFPDWTPGEMELAFSVEGLPVGTHEMNVALLGEGDGQLATGALVITIRDPQVRPEGAAIGEGIRLLASPARPSLSELWDERANLTIDGPDGTDAQLCVSLRDGQAHVLAEVRRTIRLPLDEASWTATAKSIRADQRFNEAYDAAESSLVTVARDGVGFATLQVERGFQPLRWRFKRSHDGHVTARLVDRTDSGTTTVEFYDVEAPLTAVAKDPTETIDVPARGGLAIGRTQDACAAVILPTNPNALLRMPPARPHVSAAEKSSREILRVAAGHQRWLSAELPADAFATYNQQIVGDTIARAIATLIGGSFWAALERKLANASDPADFLEDMQAALGTTQEQKALASAIAYSLFKWLHPEELLLGFHEVIAPHLAGCGVTGHPSASRFLLMLAGRPGYLTEWDETEATFLLDRICLSPILYRAARFAVLGTRALNDADGQERGF